MVARVRLRAASHHQTTTLDAFISPDLMLRRRIVITAGDGTRETLERTRAAHRIAAHRIRAAHTRDPHTDVPTMAFTLTPLTRTLGAEVTGIDLARPVEAATAGRAARRLGRARGARHPRPGALAAAVRGGGRHLRRSPRAADQEVCAPGSSAGRARSRAATCRWSTASCTCAGRTSTPTTRISRLRRRRRRCTPSALPAFGGDTQFVDVRAAFDDLPADTRRRIVQAALGRMSTRAPQPAQDDRAERGGAREGAADHPAARDPPPGERALRALPQHRAHGRHRGHAAGRSVRAHRRAVRARDPVQVRVPAPVAAPATW